MVSKGFRFELLATHHIAHDALRNVQILDSNFGQCALDRRLETSKKNGEPQWAKTIQMVKRMLRNSTDSPTPIPSLSGPKNSPVAWKEEISNRNTYCETKINLESRILERNCQVQHEKGFSFVDSYTKSGNGSSSNTSNDNRLWHFWFVAFVFLQVSEVGRKV